ncbi:Stk1 family PASTA domain-containing Ser/Thr kinase [Nocardiopsis sediminis]|uniref:non-specific serine/threonine protein kinase n=1 Tax=Nocardiopsis sediminis TaxID=1778267 RepID=A0ABV8FVP6_9ACTN
MDMTTADSLVGMTLDRRYFIEGRVASGGMATVYVAHDLRLDRRVACKVMHSSLAEDPTFVRRFINEAHSVARLSHPNVVQVYDQGSDQGHVYLAMEYVPGRTLRDLLSERGRLGPYAALKIMAPVLAALGAAHRAGMVHRDVKPENVLLTEDGQVKVADFGLARLVESAQQAMTKTGTLMGTAAYLAPEQIERGTADARTDVYAAGIMLYELITGEQPHTGETPIAVAYQHVNVDVPRPSTVLPGIGPEIDILVTKATERDPRYRPGDAAQYLAGMSEVMKNMPEDGGPATAAATMPRMDAAHAAGPPAAARSGGNATLVVDLDDVEDAGPPPDDRPLERKHLLILAGGAMAVAALVFGWWMLFGRFETVPDVIGLDEETAASVLADSGLQMEVDERGIFSDAADEGEIAGASPEIDDRIEPNGTVTVFLSRGPQTVSMPEVVGLTANDARDALEGAGFSDIELDEASSEDEPIGAVVASDPEQGTDADRAESVTLTLSTGFAVPDVAGQTQEDATDALRAKGLGVDVAEAPSDDVPAGRVISTDPGQGENVGRGDAVTLTVSSGPDRIEVPDVTGLSVEAAQRELEDLGLTVKVTAPLGGDRVAGFSPEGEVESGAEVELFVTPFGSGDDRGNGNNGNGNNGNGNSRDDD